MANRILSMKDQLETSLNDTSKPWTSILSALEGKTGVNRLYLFVGSIAVVALWLVFGFAGQLLCNTISFVYPAYVSIHAIESRTKDDDTKWLTYWVVFAIFSLFEFFADIIVGWFPLYWLAKCIFFIWLMLPTDLNGSIIVYHRVVRPYFKKHQGSIDSTVEKIKAASGKLLEKDN